MRVIGTAGHVDHGKSTLVKRLTGIDPDRLAEEQARQMTIDLGFAWLPLPTGEMVGIIDVPGHRDFIENMLAGVGGIDAVLLVVAADEGVMPQTREHLAILNLLDIQHGLIVLTKIDVVDDPDWLDLVEQDLSEITRGTSLDGAEIVRVSAISGEGIPILLDTLMRLLDGLLGHVDTRHPRLPIDRVFTISGFGTVVTGTLLGGALHTGDEIEIQPAGLRGRIRGLQSYKQQVETIAPGRRAAINIAGIDRKALSRGQVLSYPGQIQPTLMVDVHFRHLPDAGRPLKHNTEVKIHCGTAESSAHVRLLSHEILPPGEQGWLQLRLDRPMALSRGDRFILRYPSPGQTIGGGVVVNPQPGRRWKRMQSDVISELETRLSGTPAQRITQLANEPLSRRALKEVTGYQDDELDAAINEAIEQGLLFALTDGTWLSEARRQDILREMVNELNSFHRAEPLRIGMSREELRSRAGLKQAFFNVLLDTQSEIVAEGNLLRLATHSIQFNSSQQARINQLMPLMDSYTPPSFAEAVQIVGEDVLRALIDLGEIVQVQEDVIFSRAVYETMASDVLEMIDRDGSITAKALRDRFGTSRKYAIGLLEHLDSLGITKRVGDERVRGKRA